LDPVTPSKKGGGIDHGDEPTNVVRPVGDDTGMVRGSYELIPGTQLGEYRIERPLGGGGMGEVFAAVHPKIGKRAAIKVLKKELSNPFNVERFIDEAKVVNTIGHPNIVDIFAFGEMPDGRCYFVMELLIGMTLRERIAKGALGAEEVSAIIKPLTRALDAAHAKGVVHRDLKPDNVFLVDVPGEKPIVKLLDFGIAKLAKADHRIEQTKSGVMVGTPQYIAPEQAKGHAVDARADIYALGGIAFEMLTGRPPFLADNAMEMVAKHLMEAPVKPSSVVPGIPPEIDSLVVAMLAKEPNRRPALSDIAMIIDRLKLGAIQLEDARTLSYSGNAGVRSPVELEDAPRTQDEPPRLPPPPRLQTPLPLPVAAVMTPTHTPETYRGEPHSGAHTSVEPTVTGASTISPIAPDHTERDAVTIGKRRGLIIGVAVLGLAMVLSFLLVRSLGGSSEARDAAVVATTPDTGPVVSEIVPDSAADVAPDAAIVEPDAAAAVIADAAPEPPDAATVAPPRDAGVSRPKPTPKLVLDIQNAGPSVVIKINGRKAGTSRHFERELVINQSLSFEVISPTRLPKRFTVMATPSRPIVNMSVKLEVDDLMEPLK
jgi:serine/threonine protein kinase